MTNNQFWTRLTRFIKSGDQSMAAPLMTQAVQEDLSVLLVVPKGEEAIIPRIINNGDEVCVLCSSTAREMPEECEEGDQLLPVPIRPLFSAMYNNGIESICFVAGSKGVCLDVSDLIAQCRVLGAI